LHFCCTGWRVETLASWWNLLAEIVVKPGAHARALARVHSHNEFGALNNEIVMIYRLGSLGDTVVALPCFHRIAESFPTARRILLTNFPVSSKAAPLEAILGESGLIDGAIAYPVGIRSPSALWRLCGEIRALKATKLIYLMPARGRLKAVRDALFFRLCGIRQLVGLPITPDLQTNRIDPVTGVHEPECERLARTLSALGPIDLTSRAAWDLLLSEQELLAGARMVAAFSGEAFMAINMGGKAAEKDWGAERWEMLLGRLSQSYGNYGLLVVGAAEDSERAQLVTRNWPNPVIDACGRLSPRETAAAVRRAALFIGHDSGPLHLAAANGVACVGLFGGLNQPNVWHPYGDSHRIIHRMTGMAAISIEDVVDAVLALEPRHGGEDHGL
jgi:heptosyltransferase-3